MSDDFIRLVSQANPATRQYQPANNGYPPSTSLSPPHQMGQTLDPFFDDEDEDDIPDSAFGAPAAMQSKESGLPLAHSAAAPAGKSQVTLSGSIPPDWSFEDEQPEQMHGSKRFSVSLPGTSSKHQKRTSKSFKQRWKWPWQKKDQGLTGERIITLNNPVANADYCSNYVSTSKYNVMSFVPKFLLGKPAVFYHHLLLNFTSWYYRAIFKICQSLFPLHGLDSTDTRRVAHKSLYHYCTPCNCSISFGFQGDPRRSGTCSE